MAVPRFSPPMRAVLDGREFAERLAQEHPRLVARALGLTRARDAADDLVNETCLRALRFRHRFAAGSNFSAWAATILRRVFLHDLRRQRRERGLGDDQRRADVVGSLLSQASLAASCGLPAVELGGSLAARLAQALAGLPAAQRRIVALCDLNGASYADAARREQCPIGTVMSRLYRARRALAATLAAASPAVAIEVGPSPVLVA